MKIEVLGVGCPKCKKMFEAAEEAAAMAGESVEVAAVYDLDQIAKYGVASFPAIAVDGELKSAGKMLTPEAILALLK